MRDAMRYAATTGDWNRVKEVENIVETNLRTLAEEFVLGGTSRFGHKVLRHPETGETKLVFFDAVEHQGESFAAAWSREDVRISYLRAIQVMPESLELRDWIYLRTANDMFDRWLSLLNDSNEQAQGRVDVLISAPPRRTAAAQKVGYGTRTLLYEYAAKAVDQNCVEVRAVTHIGEFTREHYRRLAKHIIHPDDPHYHRIHAMRWNPSDVDLMSVVFSTTFSADSIEALEACVEETEEILFKKAFFMKGFTRGAWRRQIELIETRLKDKELVDRFHNALLHSRKYFVQLLKEGATEQDLWQALYGFENEAKRWYEDLMIENDKKQGKVKTAADEKRARRSYGQAVDGRSKGSVCQVMGSVVASLAALSESEAIAVSVTPGEKKEGAWIICPYSRGGCGRGFVYKKEMGTCCPYVDCGWDLCLPELTGRRNRMMRQAQEQHVQEVLWERAAAYRPRVDTAVQLLALRAGEYRAKMRQLRLEHDPAQLIKRLFQFDPSSNSYVTFIFGAPLRYSEAYVHSFLASKT